MGIFGSNNRYTAKQMKFQDAKNGPVMRDMLSKEGVGSILNEEVEQKEFYRRLKEEAGSGGVSDATIGKVMGDLRRGQGKTINTQEASKLSRALGVKPIYRKRSVVQVTRSANFLERRSFSNKSSQMAARPTSLSNQMVTPSRLQSTYSHITPSVH
jgi:hypothetical protein